MKSFVMVLALAISGCANAAAPVETNTQPVAPDLQYLQREEARLAGFLAESGQELQLRQIETNFAWARYLYMNPDASEIVSFRVPVGEGVTKGILKSAEVDKLPGADVQLEPLMLAETVVGPFAIVNKMLTLWPACQLRVLSLQLSASGDQHWVGHCEDQGGVRSVVVSAETGETLRSDDGASLPPQTATVRR